MNWLDIITHDILVPVFSNIKDISGGKIIFPPRKQIFTAFQLTPFDKVKVCIVGQDPYFLPGFAHGLAFSVNPDVYPLPKSLINIFKELVDDLGCDYPKNGNLIPWAKQGVLLLNSSLTVIANQANSHSEVGWLPIISSCIKTLSEQKGGLVFILWGRKAQFFLPLIDNTKHFIIQSAHPSPLSAYNGFFGSRPFSRTNEYLKNTEIDWKL